MPRSDFTRQTEVEMAAKFENWENWRSRVQDILTEKYGQPERVRVPFLYGAEEGDNAWRWVSKESLIELAELGHIRMLTYKDLEKGYEVQLARRSHRAAEEEREKDRF